MKQLENVQNAESRAVDGETACSWSRGFFSPNQIEQVFIILKMVMEISDANFLSVKKRVLEIQFIMQTQKQPN
jgi:hypothetical protein